MRRFRCTECGPQPPSSTQTPSAHLLAHIIQNIDREILGIPTRPLPHMEFETELQRQQRISGG